jgi:hypothetical protein
MEIANLNVGNDRALDGLRDVDDVAPPPNGKESL